MTVIETTAAPGAIGPYSQGFLVNGFVYTSGQIPVDPATGAVPEGIAACLGLVGYVSGANIVQTPEAVTGIYYVCNAVPVLCYALQLIGIGLIFNLDKKKTDQMYEEMAAIREAKNH